MQLRDILARSIRAYSAVRLHHLVQRCIYIFRHPRSVATHIELRAIVEPAPYLRSMLKHAVLYIELVRLIARERSIKPRQMTAGEHLPKLLLIQKISFRAALSKEQPIGSLVPQRSALVQKGPERRDACAWSDHDHRRASIRRNPEPLIRLDIDGQPLSDIDTALQHRRCHTTALAIMRTIPHDRNRAMHLTSVCFRAGCNRIQTRSQSREHRDQIIR